MLLAGSGIAAALGLGVPAASATLPAATVQLAVSPPAGATYPDSVFLTATVSAGSAPTGTVTFTDSLNGATAQPMCSNVPLVSTADGWQASCLGGGKASGIIVLSGKHDFTASYSGDAGYGPAQGVITGYVVLKPTPSLTVDPSPSGPYLVGQTVPVSALSESSTAPITITVDKATAPRRACTVTQTSTSWTGAHAQVYFAADGSCVVDINQAGTASTNPAPQVQRTFTIARLSSTIKLSRPASVKQGRPAKVTASVLDAFGQPAAGVVQFTVNGRPAGRAVHQTTGTATSGNLARNLRPGTYRVSAVFTPTNIDYRPATATPVRLVILPPAHRGK